MKTDILNNVDFFVDSYKANTNIELFSNNFTVYSPKVLVDFDCKDHIVLITAFNNVGILNQLKTWE